VETGFHDALRNFLGCIRARHDRGGSDADLVIFDPDRKHTSARRLTNMRVIIRCSKEFK